MGALGAHSFARPEERQPHDLAERHLLEHVYRLETSRHPVRDMRVEKRRVVCRDDELDFTEHVERPTACHPVDRSDDRFPEVVGLRTDVVAGIVEVPGVGCCVADPRRIRTTDIGFGFPVAHRLIAVDADAEGLFACASEHDTVDVVITPKASPNVLQLLLHLVVEGVVDLGPVQRDPCDTVDLFVENRFVIRHGAMLACSIFSNDGGEMSDALLSALDGGGRTFIAGTAFDLSTVGYSQAEYQLSGTAVSYERAGGGVRPDGEAEFATRLIVYRPTDPARFDGTVWIEWHNVSGGLDAAPGWLFTHRELIRRGAVWIGVSAQRIGVVGGDGVIGMTGTGLVGMDPERYGSLRHPGDRFSYDIFTQATLAVREAAPTILDGLSIERVIATGDSQSAFRLTTYVNEIDPIVAVHDGFMVHARGGAAGPLDDSQDPRAALRGDPVLFRQDLRVPVLCVETETDLLTLDYIRARQDDSENLVVWEIAGASHADVYTFVVGFKDDGLLPVGELAKLWIPGDEVFGMRLDALLNSGPQHYVRLAAVRHLDRWVRDGSRPPRSDRLEIVYRAFVLDQNGLAKGGIRTPYVEVPKAVLSGIGNSGGPISFLCGWTVPFSTEKLAELYPSKNSYLGQFSGATEDAVSEGFLLEDDVAEILAIAEINSPR